MRVSTKVWLIFAIISNVALLYLFRPMISILEYNDSIITFNFTIEGYIGLAFFILTNISGNIIFLRFMRTQPLSSQIFFSIIPPTITFMLLFLFFFTVNTSSQTEFTSTVRTILRIESSNAQYIWMGIVAGVYIIFISIICFIISKPLKRVEKAIELLRNGKTRKIIKIGGGKQFKNIEEDLNIINENYKNNDAILKKIDAVVFQEMIGEIKKR